MAFIYQYLFLFASPSCNRRGSAESLSEGIDLGVDDGFVYNVQESGFHRLAAISLWETLQYSLYTVLYVWCCWSTFIYMTYLCDL